MAQKASKVFSPSCNQIVLVQYSLASTASSVAAQRQFESLAITELNRCFCCF